MGNSSTTPTIELPAYENYRSMGGPFQFNPPPTFRDYNFVPPNGNYQSFINNDLALCMGPEYGCSSTITYTNPNNQTTWKINLINGQVIETKSIDSKPKTYTVPPEFLSSFMDYISDMQ